MTRSSSADKAIRGFTLVELVIVTSVLALLMSAMCGIYFATVTNWNRQQNQGNALSATSRACTRISQYLSLAVSATPVDRFGTGVYDALFVCLPAYTYSGSYVWTSGKVPEPAVISNSYGGYEPTWNSSDGRLQLRYTGTNSQWIVFYLSNSTGSYSTTGNVLWAATADRTVTPATICQDANWSRANTTVGRITPLTAIRFAVDDTLKPTRVTVTAISAYKAGNTNPQMSRSVTVFMRGSAQGY